MSIVEVIDKTGYRTIIAPEITAIVVIDNCYNGWFVITEGHMRLEGLDQVVNVITAPDITAAISLL